MILKKKIIRLLKKRDYRIGELGTELGIFGNRRAFLRGYISCMSDDKILKKDKIGMIGLVK